MPTRCIMCKATVAEVGYLKRVNEKDEPGIFACGVGPCHAQAMRLPDVELRNRKIILDAMDRC